MKLELGASGLESHVEDALTAHAEAMVGQAPEGELTPGFVPLAKAFDYHPTYFGGEFPAFGVSVMETSGPGPTSDRPERPAEFTVSAHFYFPAMPVRGARSLSEDDTSRAKRITRTLRGEFMERVLKDPELSPYIVSFSSRGGDRDEIGEARVDEAERSILWVDRSDLTVRLYA